MFKVYLNSVRASLPDLYVARSVIIGERETCIYAGDQQGALDALRALPIGISVAVRYPGGLRSCMNKQALWADIQAMDSAK